MSDIFSCSEEKKLHALAGIKMALYYDRNCNFNKSIVIFLVFHTSIAHLFSAVKAGQPLNLNNIAVYNPFCTVSIISREKKSDYNETLNC